jgi:polysaccharide biosynthesis protein PslJ
VATSLGPRTWRRPATARQVTRRAGSGDRRTPAGATRVLPSWPVDLLLFGFPLSWVLGLAPFLPVALAAVMLVLLLQQRRWVVLPGVLPWFAFCAWIVVSAVMLDSPLRLIGYGFRFANVLAVGIALVYVLNAPERLSARRVMGGLVAVWATVVVGGYLGLLFPEVRIETPTAVLLPGVLTSNEYVADLVRPPLAEVQRPWGAPEPFVRPSAPFPYANGWGAAVALFTPVAVALAVLSRSRALRAAIVLGGVALAVPAIASLNRGMFLALGVGVTYVVVRFAARGHFVAFLTSSFLALIGGAGLVQAGLLTRIAERQAVSDTTSGRAGIYRETLQRTLDSPLIGYGSPLPAYEGTISIGTQGHVWMVMFSYGFVGLALFLLFVLGGTWRSRAAPGTAGLWLHSCLVTACVAIAFYGLDTMQMLCIALVLALLLRAIYAPGPTDLPAATAS